MSSSGRHGRQRNAVPFAGTALRWRPPAIPTPRPPSAVRTQISPVPAAQGPSGQNAAVTFGNLADIGKALRAARKARHEELEQQAEAFHSPMFDL